MKGSVFFHNLFTSSGLFHHNFMDRSISNSRNRNSYVKCKHCKPRSDATFWVFTVCQCPFYETLGVNGLIPINIVRRIQLFVLYFQRILVIKLFSCSTQLSMKFSLLINMKMPTIVGIFIFISREIFMLSFV